MKDILTYIIITGLFAAVAVLGLVFDIEGFRHISFFSVWVIFFRSILVAIATEAAKTNEAVKAELLKTKFCKVPKFVYALFDVSMCFLFVFYGHFIIAAIYTISALLVSASKNELKKLQSAENT